MNIKEAYVRQCRILVYNLVPRVKGVTSGSLNSPDLLRGRLQLQDPPFISIINLFSSRT